MLLRVEQKILVNGGKVCEPIDVQPTEIIRQYTGDQSIKEPTATRRMSHWLLRELSGASFAVVARNGCNEETRGQTGSMLKACGRSRSTAGLST